MRVAFHSHLSLGVGAEVSPGSHGYRPQRHEWSGAAMRVIDYSNQVRRV